MGHAAAMMGLVGLGACGSAPPLDPGAGPGPRDTLGLEASEKAVKAEGTGAAKLGTPAYAGDEPVAWSELAPLLAEAAGRAALEELALDRMIAREMSGRGLSVSASDIAAERDRLAATLAGDASLQGNEASTVIETLRRARGLGPTRYQALLARNAALRTLAGAGAEPTPAEIDADVDARYGEKLTARILVLASERDAAAARDALSRSPATLGADFARRAMRESIDASAPAGGLLRPFSLAEPSLPVSLRQVLGKLKEGELSPVVAIDGGYALALVESRAPATTPPEGERDRARERVRSAQQRRAMDGIAADLLRRAKVTPMDAGLGWSWEGR